MKGSIGKVVATATATSLACEVPLPAVVDEVVAAHPRDFGADALAEAFEAATGRELSVDPGDLPQVVVNEAYQARLREVAGAGAHARRVRERLPAC